MSCLTCPFIHLHIPNGKPGFDFGNEKLVFTKNNIKLAFTTEERTLRLNDNQVFKNGFEGGRFHMCILNYFFSN